MENLLKIGDRIGKTDFTVKKIVKSVISRYKKGKKKRIRTTFYFISNSKGSERVLNWKKTKVSDAEQYYTFGHFKYMGWDMLEIESIVAG
jgi:hypothetical protein